jgi:hypothetical protein
MLHQVARALPGRLLFTRWSEGRALWDRVVDAAPGLLALCVMPDHLHLLHPVDLRPRLRKALSGHTRWMNHRHRRAGPLMSPLDPPGPLLDDGKIRRNVRYVHLNPCRARIVSDPLAWPLSTHRDMVGLAPFPVVSPRRDAVELHRYVSSDPHVRVEGTDLPHVSVAVPTATQVLHATSAVCRTPLSDLLRRGPARTLYLRAARTLTPERHRAIADGVDVTRWAVLAQRPREDAAVRAVARVVGDPRFPSLGDEDLRSAPGWFRYRSFE